MIAPTWLDLLDDTIAACAEHHRPDLAQRLRLRRDQLLAPTLRAVVVGESNQGKSQLVNALVNAPVCAVGDDLTTVVPTVVRHAETPTAALVRPRREQHREQHREAHWEPHWEPHWEQRGDRHREPHRDGRPDPGLASRPELASEFDGERVPVPVDEVAGRTSRRGAHRDGPLVSAEIGIPRKLLASGLVLVDTPAAGTTSSARTAAVLAAAEQADTVLLVTDATHELTGTELDLLSQVVRACPNVLVALTKIDLAPHWRQVAERDRRLLLRAGVPATLVPVSSTLRLTAARTGDTELNAESGFGELIGCLQRELAAKPEQGARRVVAVTASAVIAELVVPLRDRLATHDGSPGSPRLVQHAQAQRAVAELRRRSARWQTVLADEVGDLLSDVEHDLRERTRRILREVDRTFEEADPLQVWDDFEDWLRDNLFTAAEANLTWLAERSEWIARRVARCLPDLDGVPPESVLRFPDEPLPGTGDVERPELDRFTLGQKAFTALRNSYGGVLMFGLVTSIAGMPLLNAISLGAGAAFGGKGIRDEADMRLKRRQAVAKAAAQRHVDDVFLELSKLSRDTIRHVQRTLRDHFTDVAQRLEAELLEAASRAQRAAAEDVAARTRREQWLRQELTKLVALHGRAQALVAPQAALPQAANLGITA